MLKAASCFSGIGAPETGGPQYDWQFCAEIEPFPSAVLAERLGASPPQFMPDPEAEDLSEKEARARRNAIIALKHIKRGGNGPRNLGDVLHPDFIDEACRFGPLDLLVGGPPCQAFSFAGLRGSMSDDRGNLSLRFVEIINGIKSRVGLRNALIENVPGWLTTDDNAFGCFLGAIVGRDAPLLPSERRDGKAKKYWRETKSGELAPRWPRIGMVAGPLGRAAWRVFDAQFFGLAQRRERVFVVCDFGNGADPARVLFEPRELRGNLRPSRKSGEGTTADPRANSQGYCQPVEVPDFAWALQHRDEKGPDSSTKQGHLIPIAFSAADDGQGAAEDLSPTLRAMPPSRGGRANSGGQMAVTIPFDTSQITHPENRSNPQDGDPAYALSAEAHAPAVALVDGRWMAVRRLMPVECERLQGFEDGFTDIEWKGKPAPKGPRYRATALSETHGPGR